MGTISTIGKAVMGHEKIILVCAAVIALVCAAAFLCCREDIPSDGDRADEVRTELDGAIRNEQQAINELRTAEDTASELGFAVEAGRREVQSAIQSNEELGEGNARAAGLIRECQEILRTVRQRGTIEER